MAVCRSHQGSGRCVSDPGHGHHGWQRQLLQPDRLDPDQPNAGRRSARPGRRRPPSHPLRLPDSGGPAAAAGRDPRRAGRLRVGLDDAPSSRRTAPAVDLAAEIALGQSLVQASSEGLVTSAHDLSDGGLAQVLVESCLRHGLGASVSLEGDPFVALFSESTARALVTVADGDDRLTTLLSANGVPYTEIGVVTAHPALVVGNAFEVGLAELARRTKAPCPGCSPTADDAVPDPIDLGCVRRAARVVASVAGSTSRRGMVRSVGARGLDGSSSLRSTWPMCRPRSPAFSTRRRPSNARCRWASTRAPGHRLLLTSQR